ncbi:FKBP62 [Symbiodinium natans]|uniref:peptidylprolyl isomerase n=1 Tax=Symbiodinium natans TaxID=878477 RepID=A0A812RL59_9DINO|nr:FKBP62 [Symbiodinium natans]
MSDDDMGMRQELPEGIKKEILKEAPESNYSTPKAGDEVTVHYVGTLESDGTEFDSSRSRDKPFTFIIGKGQVIEGWDLGVATMKKGEVAKFTIASEHAYGDQGSPPKIPEKATLIFEVELLDFTNQEDLFSDGGVLKVMVKEGSGWKAPQMNTELKISLKVCKPDGSVIEDKGSFEYTMGSTALGPLTKAVEKALLRMKKGEQCKLQCSKDYALGDAHPEGVVIDLAIDELYEVTDVSIAKDKSLMKKQIKEGEGYERPKESAKISLKVEAATDGSGPLSGFSAKTLEFAAGDGNVCDALELAVMDMKKGERALLTCTSPALCQEAQLGLAQIKADKVVFTLELSSFEKAKDIWDMSEDEKIEFASARKEVGGKLFKEGRFLLAMERYKKVADMFSYTDNYQAENKAKATDLKKVCTLNKAACQLKCELFADAKTSCNTVLKDDSANLKALFRRAQAELGLKNFGDCTRDVKRILEIDPQNREARALAKQAASGQKEEDQKSKGLFGKMCQALGKGPIREPYKERRFDFDAEQDEDMPQQEEGEAKEA